VTGRQANRRDDQPVTDLERARTSAVGGQRRSNGAAIRNQRLQRRVIHDDVSNVLRAHHALVSIQIRVVSLGAVSPTYSVPAITPLGPSSTQTSFKNVYLMPVSESTQ